MNLRQLQRWSYLFSRGIGDYQAARRGPEALGRRLARREIVRTVFRVLR